DKTDSVMSSFRNCCKTERSTFTSGFSSTGNAAFDEWRKQELSRLDEERRKLDDARAEFESYAEELRRARDKEEFDRFMSKRRESAGKESMPSTRSDNASDSISGV